MNADVFNEAQQTQDILDDSNSIAQNLNYMISQSDQRRHQEMVNRLQSATNSPTPSPTTTVVDPYIALTSQPQPRFNPYPTSINQTVIQPLSSKDQPNNQAQQPSVQQAPPDTTSTSAISPDIMKLASNTDLSIETIAREAHRITEKEAALDGNEVIISLR